MKDIIKQWLSDFIKLLGTVFGILGAISVFLPLADVTSSNIWTRIGILLGFVIVIALASSVWTYCVIHKKKKNVYSSVKTNIIFEYADINDILKAADADSESITVVVPVNTNLEIDFKRELILKNTIHRLCLDYIFERRGTDIDKVFLDRIPIKKDGFDSTGKIGDWFLITAKDLEIASNIQFLFVEFFDTIEKNGKIINAELDKQQFIIGLQSLISAIPYVLDPESKVYVPLIGAGAGNVGKPKDIMHFMKAMLRFNKAKLRQEIHVVINEKYKSETPIYQLGEF